MVNPHIFRQYDIRGVVGRDIDASVAESIGRSFGTLLRRRSDPGRILRVALGQDNRLSSPELAAGVRAGLTSAGVNVLDVGTVPTPALNFTAAHEHTDGAIQVTGSHNPPEYNGFKLGLGASSLYGKQIQEIYRLASNAEFVSGSGSVRQESVLDLYVDDVATRIGPLSRPLKVVADAGNGAGALVARKLLDGLGLTDARCLFCESDGTFPNHHPDPVVDKNLQHLVEKVRETKADLGVAFDGDADRIGAVDDRGEIVRGDTLLLIYGVDLVERHGPGQKVVFDVKCSQALPDVLTEMGGEAIMSATGHSLIKQRMKDEGALLAGELSGHIMFADNYYGFDDALFAACLLISIVARSPKSLSERLAAFPRFVSTSELRYPATEEAKFGIVTRAVEHFKKRNEVIDVDGARVLFGDGWGLIRASNTEPVLVGRFEARDEARLAEIRETMEGWLRSEGVSPA
ncbi:MAG: phosphomannomutase/phosphoglucomutase [Gemmatimonadetes bacterium]|nr:phosphomannomutase/phosphoglucomutase [Gemmatimonadota bacterium]